MKKCKNNHMYLGLTYSLFFNRKPFHPKRLNELMLAPFFATPIDVEEEEDMTEEVKEMSEEEIKMAVQLKLNLDMERDKIMEKLQTEAIEKQKERTAVMGELLRSKGFLWLATSNDLIGAWQQAGNVLRIRAETQWMCLQPEVWEGTPVEDLVRKVWNNKYLVPILRHLIFSKNQKILSNQIFFTSGLNYMIIYLTV